MLGHQPLRGRPLRELNRKNTVTPPQRPNPTPEPRFPVLGVQGNLN